MHECFRRVIVGNKKTDANKWGYNFFYYAYLSNVLQSLLIFFSKAVFILKWTINLF